jgi:hypothetical protein
MTPGDAGEQDEHDRVETDTVIDTRTATARIGRALGNQRRSLPLAFSDGATAHSAFA